MKSQTQHVLQRLFSESSMDNIPVEKLRQLVDEYPYFTLGHLLLAQKLQTINAAQYEAQSEMTCLYFNEPIWLQSLLHPSDEKGSAMREKPGAIHAHERQEPQDEHQLMVEQDVIVDEVPQEEMFPPLSPDNGVHRLENSAPVEESNPIEEEPEQPPIDEATPIFEPYHTVDYFASQGIRVSNEINPDDKLGQQLKRFTEWLKTMKRLPETKVDEQLDEVAQQNIQEFAEHSLDQKEVITETMAEVLIKQHKHGEAVAIYEKLSLQNPSKRAYFAAKIEQLKGS